MKFSNPVIVLGSGAVTGPGAIRSLRRARVTFYQIDEEKTIVKYSKYRKEYFVFPKIKEVTKSKRRLISVAVQSIYKHAP